MSNAPKILLAMSGGIDSTAAALLLIEKGYDVVGCTFTTRYSSAESVQSAVDLAESLGIEHHLVDFDSRFQNEIVEYFRNEYLSGRTPNPCVLCNKRIKFGALLEVADAYGCDKIATGHYARILKPEYQPDSLFIATAEDTTKDQSYFLWMLSQQQLKRVIFPLGNMTKTQVRSYLSDRGFVALSKKTESQDICFIPDDYREFLNFCQPGNYVDENGRILGTHTGFANYTIGQRKGLGIALGHPAFVTKIDAKSNEVTLGKNEDLLRKIVLAKNIIIHDKTCITDIDGITAKIRYRSKAVKVNKIEFLVGDKPIEYEDLSTNQNASMKVHFCEDIWGVTPGQSLVLYKDNLLIGGGIIIKEK